MKERVVAHFGGMVQGVGFRYTTVHIARAFPGLVGYVRNLCDGRVEVVAEAEEDELGRFVEEVKGEMGGYVRDVSVRCETATGEFNGFGVRF